MLWEQGAMGSNPAPRLKIRKPLLQRLFYLVYLFISNQKIGRVMKRYISKHFIWGAISAAILIILVEFIKWLRNI